MSHFQLIERRGSKPLSNVGCCNGLSYSSFVKIFFLVFCTINIGTMISTINLEKKRINSRENNGDEVLDILDILY